MGSQVAWPLERELVLGGQRSGKSRRAEAAAAAWLGMAGHHAVMIATARQADGDMRERIEIHRRDRAAALPDMRTIEEPVHLAAAIRGVCRSDTMVVVDCLTLWLTNWMMPLPGTHASAPDPHALEQEIVAVADAVLHASGPLVIVSNEIGLGVVPLGRESRLFADTLGRLNQRVAAACDRVTLMIAGLPVRVKERR
jgi:adenosylcobinamide kinase / adenosylcobinamide-phosphate guanylyltransferase